MFDYPPLLLLLFTNGFCLAVPIWHLLIWAPHMFTSIGRNKFVPIMMRSTSLLFRRVLPCFSAASLAISFLANRQQSLNLSDSWLLPSSAISFAAVCANALVVVPRALSAGAKSFKSEDSEQSLDAFIIDGASTEGTRFWHQSVIVVGVTGLAGSVGVFAALCGLI